MTEAKEYFLVLKTTIQRGNRYITVWSSQQGKITLNLKHATKVNSRRLMLSETGVLFQAKPYYGNQIPLLLEGRVVSSFLNLRKNFTVLSNYLFLLFTIDVIMRPNLLDIMENEFLFKQVIKGVALYNKHLQQSDLLAIVSLLLENLGYLEEPINDYLFLKERVEGIAGRKFF